jgi:hypothetical protein
MKVKSCEMRAIRQIDIFMSHFFRLQRKTEGKMALGAHLAELSEKHKLLKRRIEEEMARPAADEAKIRRLKHEKLKIKDAISRLQDESGTRH